MPRVLTLAIGFGLALAPAAAGAQSLADLAAGNGPTSLPRAVEDFAIVQDYASLLPERTGMPAQPVLNELGTVLLVRMFRVVCLGLEQGAALDTVMPEGFSPYPETPYYFGVADPGEGGPLVLSATGDADRDETNGHPTIWLRPNPEGMSCRIDWSFEAPLEDPVQANIANVLAQWLPYELALVRAMPPMFITEPLVTDFSQWDRPCSDRWCPVTVNYSLPNGNVSLETVLNITGIQGDRP